MNPRAVNVNSEGRSEKTKKRPIEPVIDNIAAVAWPFEACEIWQDRFVGYGWIIKRKCTGKESVSRNSVRMRGMNAPSIANMISRRLGNTGSSPYQP